jgi:signal transduction histidine kinase
MRILADTLIFLLLAAIVASSILLFRYRAAARALREARAEEARRLEEGRKHAETHYTLDKLRSELNSLRSGERPPDPPLEARLEELATILTRAGTALPKPFPISGPCAEVIDAFREVAQGRDLLYSESGDGRWLQVLGDRELLRWAVQEVFRNVVHHAEPWTRITVKAEPVAGGVLLTIRDDGCGLDRPSTARMYTSFSPRLESPGPGVGLFVVRRIVETLGGKIEARSVPGGGLLHSMRLPHPPGGPYGG